MNVYKEKTKMTLEQMNTILDNPNYLMRLDTYVISKFDKYEVEKILIKCPETICIFEPFLGKLDSFLAYEILKTHPLLINKLINIILDDSIMGDYYSKKIMKHHPFLKQHFARFNAQLAECDLDGEIIDTEIIDADTDIKQRFKKIDIKINEIGEFDNKDDVIKQLNEIYKTLNYSVGEQKLISINTSDKVAISYSDKVEKERNIFNKLNNTEGITDIEKDILSSYTQDKDKLSIDNRIEILEMMDILIIEGKKSKKKGGVIPEWIKDAIDNFKLMSKNKVWIKMAQQTYQLMLRGFNVKQATQMISILINKFDFEGN